MFSIWLRESETANESLMKEYNYNNVDKKFD